MLEEIPLCDEKHENFKSYMDYRAITDKTSKQYQLIYSDKIVVGDDGLLYCGEYIGLAMGSRFGQIGDKFVITLDDGVEFKAIKLDEKADSHTYNGCHHRVDSSIIEFVICTEKAKESYPLAIKMGNFDYAEGFSGEIVKIQKEN